MSRILSLLLLLPLFCAGKDHEVKIRVRNLPAGSEPRLLQLFNGNFFTIDSLPVTEGETILFRIPENHPAGNVKAILGISVYAKYTQGQPTAVDLLFNREDIEAELDFNNPGTLNIVRSKENRLFYDYIRKDARIVHKLGLLEQFTGQYPDRDGLYQTALEYFKEFQKERNLLIDSIYQAEKPTLAARIIQTMKLPYTEGNISAAQRDSLFKNHFFDQFSFTDTTLLYTSAYTDKLFRYLQYFAQQQAASPRQNEAELMKHIDYLVERISENEQVRNRLLDFIIDGLESMQYEEILNHISSNYLEQCDGPLEVTKRRLEAYQKMAVGEQVSDFFSIDTSSVAYNLYADLSPYTLVIFWHSQCPHCQELLKQLPKLVEEGDFAAHGVKIVTVSIDSERESWKEFSRKFPMPWTNTFIPGGFDSETAADFNLYATPTLFLLDAEHKIVSKPQVLEDVRSDLKNLK